MCRLHWPHRRQASSHRYSTGFSPCVAPVRASLWRNCLVPPALASSPASQLPQIQHRFQPLLLYLWEHLCGATALCRLHWPHRRQASSHRYSTGFSPCVVPVGASLWSNCLVPPALASSPASQLPQIQHRFQPLCCTCGSISVAQLPCAACIGLIAGKPAPTDTAQVSALVLYLWEHPCGATALCRLHWPHRRQASSHRYSTGFSPCVVPVGAGLPAMGCAAAPRFAVMPASRWL